MKNPGLADELGVFCEENYALRDQYWEEETEDNSGRGDAEYDTAINLAATPVLHSHFASNKREGDYPGQSKKLNETGEAEKISAKRRHTDSPFFSIYLI